MADYPKRMIRFTKKKKNAKQAINEDDARGYRKRKAKAMRIKGETKAKPKGFAQNPGDLGKFIEGMQKKKPY